MKACPINDSIPLDEWRHKANCVDSFGFSGIMPRYRSSFRTELSKVITASKQNILLLLFNSHQVELRKSTHLWKILYHLSIFDEAEDQGKAVDQASVSIISRKMRTELIIQ